MRLNKADWPSAREWWEALRWVLLVFTLVVFVTMAGSFVSYSQVVQDGHPWLPAIHCPGCILCGMTRSFCAMSAGQWSEALNWNHGGPFLYTAGWTWLALSLGFLVTKARSFFVFFRGTSKNSEKSASESVPRTTARGTDSDAAFSEF